MSLGTTSPPNQGGRHLGCRTFTLLGRTANPRELAGAASALRAGSYVIPHFPIMGMPEHGYLGYLPVVIA